MHSNSPVRTHPYFASCYLSVSLNHGLRLTPWAPGQQLSLFPLLLPVFLAPPPEGGVGYLPSGLYSPTRWALAGAQSALWTTSLYPVRNALTAQMTAFAPGFPERPGPALCAPSPRGACAVRFVCSSGAPRRILTEERIPLTRRPGAPPCPGLGPHVCLGLCGVPAPAADPVACPRASSTAWTGTGVQCVRAAARARPPPGCPWPVFSRQLLPVAFPRGCASGFSVSGVASGMRALRAWGFVAGRGARAGLPET